MTVTGIVILSYFAGMLVYGTLHYSIAETFSKQTLVSTAWDMLLWGALFWPVVYLSWVFRLVLWTGKVFVERRREKNRPKPLPSLPSYPKD